jgi:hypothetical protein
MMDWIKNMKELLVVNYNQHRTCILVAAGLFLLAVVLVLT